MGMIIPQGKQQYLATTTGAPLVGGKLFTFAAGTNTPKTTWSDANETAPNTNPIILDARGECVAFWNGAYKVLLQDALGNVIWTVDNVVSPDTGGAAAAILARLADSSDLSNGDALIAVKRTDIAAAVALTLHEWNQRASVNVRQIGVTGDGTTDDGPLLNTLSALGIPLYVPYTSTGYKLATQWLVQSDVYCDGFFTPTSTIGAAVNDYDRFTIVLGDPNAYSVKRQFVGIVVRGSVALRAANVSGIRIDAPNSTLTNCIAQQLNFGIVVRNYSITLSHCAAQQCNTNLDGYARSFNKEINTLTIDGGNYDSPVNVSINLGDTSWSDALAAGNSHGVVINIINGANTDGGESRLDNVGTVLIEGTYSETTNTDCLWRLGGSGDGNLRNVSMMQNFWKTARYAVKCLSGVQGFDVGPNFLSGIASAEVMLSTVLYGIRYTTGVPIGSFSQGPISGVALAFGSVAIADVTFAGITIDNESLIYGVQTSPAALSKYYPGGEYRSGQTTYRNISSAAAAWYAAPSLTKAGTVSGGTFTFTTLADCYRFNGGDAIVTAPTGATYVRSVNYATGTMVIDGGVTAAGAATVSQRAASLLGVTTSFSGVAPTTGTWLQGSVAWNGVATVGQPKGWQCTVTGTPGTWASMGNL